MKYVMKTLRKRIQTLSLITCLCGFANLALCQDSHSTNSDKANPLQRAEPSRPLETSRLIKAHWDVAVADVSVTEAEFHLLEERHRRFSQLYSRGFASWLEWQGSRIQVLGTQARWLAALEYSRMLEKQIERTVGNDPVVLDSQSDILHLPGSIVPVGWLTYRLKEPVSSPYSRTGFAGAENDESHEPEVKNAYFELARVALKHRCEVLRQQTNGSSLQRRSTCDTQNIHELQILLVERQIELVDAQKVLYATERCFQSTRSQRAELKSNHNRPFSSDVRRSLLEIAHLESHSSHQTLAKKSVQNWARERADAMRELADGELIAARDAYAQIQQAHLLQRSVDDNNRLCQWKQSWVVSRLITIDPKAKQTECEPIISSDLAVLNKAIEELDSRIEHLTLSDCSNITAIGAALDWCREAISIKHELFDLTDDRIEVATENARKLRNLKVGNAVELRNAEKLILYLDSEKIAHIEKLIVLSGLVDVWQKWANELQKGSNGNDLNASFLRQVKVHYHQMTENLDSASMHRTQSQLAHRLARLEDLSEKGFASKLELLNAKQALLELASENERRKNELRQKQQIILSLNRISDSFTQLSTEKYDD